MDSFTLTDLGKKQVRILYNQNEVVIYVKHRTKKTITVAVEPRLPISINPQMANPLGKPERLK